MSDCQVMAELPEETVRLWSPRRFALPPCRVGHCDQDGTLDRRWEQSDRMLGEKINHAVAPRYIRISIVRKRFFPERRNIGSGLTRKYMPSIRRSAATSRPNNPTSIQRPILHPRHSRKAANVGMTNQSNAPIKKTSGVISGQFLSTFCAFQPRLNKTTQSNKVPACPGFAGMWQKLDGDSYGLTTIMFSRVGQRFSKPHHVRREGSLRRLVPVG